MGDISNLVAAFVLVIVGAVLLTQIAGQTTDATSRVTETQSISYTTAFNATGSINSSVLFYPTRATEAASGWRTGVSDCNAAHIMTGTLTNSSGTVFTPTTDYVVNNAGYFYLINTATVNKTKDNVTLFTTTYCQDDYVYGFGATVMLLIPGFFAIALMAIGVGLFYSIAREHNIL